MIIKLSFTKLEFNMADEGESLRIKAKKLKTRDNYSRWTSTKSVKER